LVRQVASYVFSKDGGIGLVLQFGQKYFKDINNIPFFIRSIHGYRQLKFWSRNIWSIYLHRPAVRCIFFRPLQLIALVAKKRMPLPSGLRSSNSLDLLSSSKIKKLIFRLTRVAQRLSLLLRLVPNTIG
jgi:hypothetical protein